METSETFARFVRRWLRLSLLSICLLGGCGGGNQDFGPTRTIDPKLAKKDPGPAPNSEAPTKPSESARDAVKADTKAVSPASQPSAKMDPTAIAAKSESDDKSNPSQTRDGNAPAAPAKTAETVAESPEVAWKPLSPELREWLIAKRRQTGSADGLAVLTAANLSRVSWHDVPTGQLSHEFVGKTGLTTGLVYGPARQWIIGAADAGWLRLWTIEPVAGLDRFARESRRAAQALLGSIDTEQSGVWSLAADRQGQWILCGGADGSLRICSVAAVTQSEDAAREPAARLAIKLGAKLPAHDGIVTDLEISADDLWIASGGSDHRVCLWDTKTGTVTRTWSESPDQITDVGLSADGKIVAAACLDKFVRWWSADAPEPDVGESETKPAKTNPADPQKVSAIETKPTKTNPAAVQKGATKESKPKNILEHPDLVLSVAVSSDGHFVATGGKDKLVRVWDLATGQIVEKHDGSKDVVVEVRFLEGDKRLFIRDRAGVVRIKPRMRGNTGDDDPSPPEIERAFQFITPPAVLNAGGESIPVGTENGDGSETALSQTELRNAASHEARAAARQPLLKATDPTAEESELAKAAQVVALEKQLASAASDFLKADLKKQISRLKTIPVSQERTERPKLLGTLTTSFQFVAGPASQNRMGPRTVQLSIHGDAESLTATTSTVGNDLADQRRKSADSAASQLWVWDIATQALLRHWDDLRSPVGTCAIMDSTNQVLSSSGQVFSLPTGESRTLSGLAPESISAIATAPDGRHLAIGYAGSVQSATKVLRLFETATLSEIKSHEAYEGLTTAIAFAPDGTSLAVAIRERQLHRLLILDATTLAVQATIEEQPHSAPWLQGTQSENRDRGLTTLRFSSDGRSLLTHGSYGSGDYRLTLWQKKGAKWTKETGVNSKATQPIIDDAQPPVPLWFVGGKGSQLAAINSKGLGIVDTSNGRLLRSVELNNGLKDRQSVAWSADGTWLAQGDETGQVTLWNLRLDKDAAIFPAQLGPVKALALSSDGRVLATLGEENKLHLWNLENWQPKNRVAPRPKTAKPVTTE